MEYYLVTNMKLTIVICKNIGESQSAYADWMKLDQKPVYSVWLHVY